MGPVLSSVRGDGFMVHHALSNCSSADDAHPPNGRASGEDECRRRRECVLLQSCAHAVIETAGGGVENVVGAATGDAMPRVEEASAASNVIEGGDEKSAAPRHETIRRVDQGRPRAHDATFAGPSTRSAAPEMTEMSPVGLRRRRLTRLRDSASHRRAWARVRAVSTISGVAMPKLPLVRGRVRSTSKRVAAVTAVLMWAKPAPKTRWRVVRKFGRMLLLTALQAVNEAIGDADPRPWPCR